MSRRAPLRFCRRALVLFRALTISAAGFDGIITRVCANPPLIRRSFKPDGQACSRRWDELSTHILSDVSNEHAHFLTLGLVFTIWIASSGFAAAMDGLNLVHRVRETRPVWKTRPIALGLTLVAGSLLLVAVVVICPLMWSERRIHVSPKHL
jgi:hypothetical protein